MEEFPPGFEDSGIPEEVRPEQVSPDDYRLPTEYQELLGERKYTQPDDATRERAEGPVPIEEIGEVTVAPVAEPDVTGHEWPFEEAPSGAEDRGPAEQARDTLPPLTPEADTWPEPPSTGEPEVETPPLGAGPPDIAESPEMPEPPPPGGTGRNDDLHSFFFEGEQEQKGKEKKGEPEDFWK